uniref:Si:ch211-214j24.15 n=1 Tax=Acanthochromis polyacanthus TaxID=80966 RepID=A0A3Q1GMM2_9TELE
MENGNSVFEMQENILQATAEEKRRVEERAQLRFIRMKKQRSQMRERLRPVSDIRIVLLGAKGSGKTSALNTILGRESIQQTSRTAQCVVGKGVLFGRQVTVVDTPGWWMNYFCAESAIFDQREMVLGLSLCPPGPHVFLLVIRVDRAFTETYRRSVQEHLELISQHIWSRVLLLFSFGDWLGGTTTEQYIESEGEPLRWLVERCNNRYHILNSKTKGDEFQVRELIGKLEEIMMSGCSSGRHYEIERRVLEQLEGKMKQEKDRAKDRLMRRKTQRQMAKSQLEKLNSLPEMRIVLIGGRKTGKSSCGNTILNQKSFDTDVQTISCAEKRGEIGGKLVSVLDTPGCFSVTADVLTASSAILLVINVSSSFKDAHREALEEQLEAGGGRLWRRTMVLFSYGDWLGDTSIEQRIESEGESLQRLVEKCGNRYHVVDNKHWRDGAQVKELMELVEEMMVEERMDVLQGGDHMSKSVSLARDVMTLSKKDIKELIKRRHQLFSDLPESASSTPDCTAAAQIVTLPGHRARRRTGFTIVDMSYIGSVLSGAQGLRWSTGNIPVWLSAPHLTLNSLMHPRNQTMLLVSSHNHHRTLAEEDTISVHSLCHPVLKDRTLRRLSESGGLQMLIDQWGSSSLEELEAFIDSYFEMVWEETMGSCQDAEPDRATAELDAVIEEAAEEKEKEVLSSIDRKLSKLELLEEIRSDLVELKQNLESSWRAIQELGDKNKRSQDDTC